MSKETSKTMQETLNHKTFNLFRQRTGLALLLLACFGVSTQAWARFEPVTCKNTFTQDQEIAEGNKVALQVYQQMPILPENDPLTRYVQQLGASLVRNAPLAPGVTHQWPFNFHVVASEDINAFALPGGSIFVNLGTVQAAESEAQLAGVMAHEISHVVMRHSTCNLGKQRNRSLLYGLGAIGSAILLGNGTAGQLAQEGIGLGENLDFMHMSRDDEKQADLLGTGVLYDTRYDPRGLPQFFEIIRAKYGAGGAQFMSDHPNPGNRTQYVNQEIATLPPRSKPVVSTAAFVQIHTVATQRKALTAKEVQSGAWKGSGQYASQPGGRGVVMANTPVQTGAQRGQGDGGTQQGGGGTQGQSQQGIAPLSRAQLGLRDAMVPLKAGRFALRYPSSWGQSAGANGAVTLAPNGGAGSFGIAYGVVAGVENQSGNGATDVSSLQAATTALVQRLVSENSGLSQAGRLTSMQIAGRPANAVELRGTSPVVENGSQLFERDLLVTVSRPDGDICSLVFVAPEREFSTLKPVFEAIAASLQPQ